MIRRKKPVTLEHVIDVLIELVHDLGCVLAWIAVLVGLILLIGR